MRSEREIRLFRGLHKGLVVVRDGSVTQRDFGAAVGISQQAVSDLVHAGVLQPGASGSQWLLAYCARLREQAEARLGATPEGLDVVQERAKLARELRVRLEMKNAVLRLEYAPAAWLGSVLATVSQAVADRLDQLPGQLPMKAPALPESAVEVLTVAFAQMRAEWLRCTSDLTLAKIAEVDTDSDVEVDPQAGDEAGAA